MRCFPTTSETSDVYFARIATNCCCSVFLSFAQRVQCKMMVDVRFSIFSLTSFKSYISTSTIFTVCPELYKSGSVQNFTQKQQKGKGRLKLSHHTLPSEFPDNVVDSSAIFQPKVCLNEPLGVQITAQGTETETRDPTQTPSIRWSSYIQQIVRENTSLVKGRVPRVETRGEERSFVLQTYSGPRRLQVSSPHGRRNSSEAR